MFVFDEHDMQRESFVRTPPLGVLERIDPTRAAEVGPTARSRRSGTFRFGSETDSGRSTPQVGGSGSVEVPFLIEGPESVPLISGPSCGSLVPVNSISGERSMGYGNQHLMALGGVAVPGISDINGLGELSLPDFTFLGHPNQGESGGMDTQYCN